LVNGCIELVEQKQLLIVNSTIALGLPCAYLRKKTFILSFLVAQLLSKLVYLVQKSTTLTLSFRVADRTKAKAQRFIILSELTFLRTMILNLNVIDPLQGRLKLFFKLIWTHDW
jgi:hypothetical protein